MAKRIIMLQNKLKEFLSYDKNTGLFIWKKFVNTNVIVGSVAGNVDKNGYIVITLKSKKYFAHRLAWLYEYGVMPIKSIDHINQIKTDNKICNLREVTHTENNQNRPIQKNNRTGFKGVFWSNRANKWTAQIQLNYKKIHLGYFINKEDAITARKEANIKYGFHKNHGKQEK